MHRALDALPVNVLLLGKGNTRLRRRRSTSRSLAGAGGFKLHEDWGSTPAAIDACLRACERWRRAGGDPHRHAQRGRLSSSRRSPRSPAARSTPTTPRARAAATRRTSSRSPRTPNVLPSSTNPTRPHTRQHARRAPRHADGLPPPQPAGARGPRVRRDAGSAPTTIAAEDVLHDLGAISMIGSDSQAMGRVGETIIRTWQTAHVDEGALRAAAGDERGRQRARPPLRRQVHDLPGGRPRHRRRGRLGRGRQARRPRAVGPGLLRRAPAPRAQGRRDRLGADRRRERLDPDAPAGPRPADVRRRPARPRRPCRVSFVAPAALEDGLAERLGLRRALRAGRRHARRRQGRHARTTTRCPQIRSTPRPSSSRSTASRSSPTPPAELPLAQRYSLF